MEAAEDGKSGFVDSSEHPEMFADQSSSLRVGA